MVYSYRVLVAVNVINPDLLEVTVTVCWQEKNLRIYGEDINFNNQLEPGEDTPPPNGRMDSPVQIISFIYNR